MSAPSILSARDLTVRYAADFTALQCVDFDLYPGERVALIGSNGSGKSTLLRCLTGLQTATSGEAKALGHVVSDMSQPRSTLRKAVNQNIGWVFQHHGLVRRMCVLSNVVHGMLGRKGSWRSASHHTAPTLWRLAAMDALAKVNLDDFALRRADTLSGGQQQRVAIARALIRQPTVIVADEPTASLDPVSGDEVMQTLKDCQLNHRCALLFTCHDLDHARRYATRIVGLNQGAVDVDCKPSELDDKKLDALYGKLSAIPNPEPTATIAQ